MAFDGQEAFEREFGRIATGGLDTFGVRCRWVVNEAADHRSDQFCAATPPLEALRLIWSEAATGSPPAGVSRCGTALGGNVRLLGVNEAHLRAPVVRDVCVGLPPERAQPGYCCRLKKRLLGTRDAPRQWERSAVAAAASTRPGWSSNASIFSGLATIGPTLLKNDEKESLYCNPIGDDAKPYRRNYTNSVKCARHKSSRHPEIQPSNRQEKYGEGGAGK